MTQTNATYNEIVSYNPATGERLGSVPLMDEAEVREAVQRARKAAEGWSALTHEDRAAQLRRVRDHFAAHALEIAERVVAETGKPRIEALTHEVFAVCETFRSLERLAPKVLSPQKVSAGQMGLFKRALKLYEPHGVIGVIAPWNFPLTLSMTASLTALYAGNTVVLKPSEVTPLVGRIVEDAFAAGGVDKDVLQVVYGDGSTGAALVGSGVDKIAFTGSTATGKKIMEAAARTLTPVVMELGGKDPMIVCADADVGRAASGAVWAAFANSGQICMSVERVYVHEDVYDSFVEKVLDRTIRLHQGVDDGTERVDVGAMITPTQLETVARHVEDARQKGATILTGGHARDDLPGDFYEPTVLTNVQESMDIMREETFGPILPIMKVESDDEAVRLANDSPYGLTASVWTANEEHGMRIAGALQSGSVLVNDHITVYGITSLPFGGVKESGFGRVHGEEGLREFARPKSIVVDRFQMSRDLTWFPYPTRMVEIMVRLIGVQYREKPIDRLKALLGIK